MTNDLDADHMLRALSARIAVIEMAISALAPSEPAAQRRTLKTFEALSQAMLDHFLAEPVDESYIELVRRSIDDVRALLASPS